MIGPVLIRADADHAIGLGHVMRCLALAQELIDRGVRVAFACRALPDTTRARLLAEGCEVLSVGGPVGSARDASDLLAHAAALDVAWLVVDGYAFDEGYQRALAGRRLLWLDDEARLARWDVDLLLNQNLHADAARYPGRATLLLGPTYALLRRELRRRCRDPREGDSVVFMFGGADVHDLGSRALEALHDPRLRDVDALLVVGAANPRLSELQERAARLGARARLLVDVADVGEVLQRAGSCISAAGSSLWELAAFGIPSAVIVAADNQRENGRRAAARGAVLLLGEADTIEPRHIAEAVHALQCPAERRRLGDAIRGLTDGRGAIRVADAMVGETR